MRKVTLDFGGPASASALTRREIHEYIAKKMAFPEYYGQNLDALYDCLTEITEPTAVGLSIPALSENQREPDQFDAMNYFRKVQKTFADAEAANPNLVVFAFPH